MFDMYFTKSSIGSAARVLAVVAIAFASLLVVPLAADPYQPIRCAVIAAALALVVALGPSRTVPHPIARAATWAVAAYLVLVGLSAAVNGVSSAIWGVHGRFGGLFSVVLFALAGVVGYAGLDRSMRLLARATSLSILVQSAWMLGQWFSGRSVDGSLGNAALAGQWLCVAVAVVIGAGLAERGIWRGVGIAAIVAAALALGVSGSRAAWLGVLAAVLTVAVLGRLRARVPLALLAAGLLVGIILGGSTVAGKLAPSDLSSGSAGSRLEIWRGTASMIADHPVLGVGLGRLIYEFPRYESAKRSALEPGDARVDVAHSRVLQSASDGGVGAALALCAAWALAVVAGWRGARHGDVTALAATAGLVAFGVQGLFGISTVETDVLGWVLGGIALARAQASMPAASTGASRIRQRAVALLCVLVSVGATYYLINDVRFAQGRSAFQQVDFVRADTTLRETLRRNPFVDTYRVALADVTMNEAAIGSSGSVPETVRVLDAGIAYEPDSYDLHASKARLLAVAGSGSRGAAGTAFRDAMRLYPRGIGVREEFLAFAQATGDPQLVAEARSELAAASGGTIAPEGDE